MASKEKDEDFDPETVNSTLLVLGHIGVKGLQAGSIIGLFLALPIAAFRHRRVHGAVDSSFLPRANRVLQRSAAWTTVASLFSGVGLLGFKEGWDKEKIEDRAYRLHYNSGQNRTDEFSRYGGVAGAAGAFLTGSRSLSGLTSGLIVGMAAGTIAHVASSQSDTGGQVESVASSAQKVAEELKR